MAEHVGRTRRAGDALGARNLRSWMAYWKPAALVAIDVDGVETPIAIAKTNRKWNIAKQAIESVNAVLVRAYDESSNLIATTETDYASVARRQEREAIGDDDPEPAVLASSASGGIDVAAVQAISKAVVDAAKELNASSERRTDSAFNAVLALVKESISREKILSDRLVAMETAWHDALVSQAEAHAALAGRGSGDESDDGTDDLAKTVLGAAMPEIIKHGMGRFAGGAPRAPRPGPARGSSSPPNGAAPKPDKEDADGE